MPYRQTVFVNLSFYHIFNRGVEKRKVFLDDSDYSRFIESMIYYQYSGPKPRFSQRTRFKIQDFVHNSKLVEIICYCLMPNHFHFLIKQVKDGGIQEFISKLSNSYTKYFNIKYKRVGYLFQGKFKDVLVESDEQLLHLSRYIHLNPYAGKLVEDLNDFKYSSYSEYCEKDKGLCNKDPILAFFKKPEFYQKFINDHQEYAKSLESIKHIILEKI